MVPGLPTRIDSGMESLVLRPDQHDALDAIATRLLSDSRAQHISACGTGKTVVAIATAEHLNARTVLVLVPNLALMGQTIASWRRWTARSMAAVCSDDDVVRRGEDDLNVDDAEWECPVLHSSSEISEWWTAQHPTVLFSTYQSLHLVEAAGGHVDLLIADEAHWLVTAGEQGHLRSVQSLNADMRLFQTATPRIGAGQTMEEPSIFGHIAYEMTFAQAIRLGIIADYRLIILELTGAAPLDDTWESSLAVSVEALRQLHRDWPAKRTLVYANRVAHAEEFAEHTGCTVITGQMPASRREPILQRFRDDGGVIANVRCLNEGVDVPDLDAILFAEPRSGVVDVTQSIGRVLRRKPDGRRGIIVLPVFASPEDDDPYAKIVDTLQIMTSMDGRLRQTLTQRASTNGPAVDGEPDVHIEGSDPARVQELITAVRGKIGLRETNLSNLIELDELVSWVTGAAA